MRSILGVVAPVLLACASSGPPPQIGPVPPSPAGDSFPNWPHPPLVTFEELQFADRAEIDVRSREGAGGGVTGAEKVDAFIPALDHDVRFKVKRVPRRLDGVNNSPRKEIAAYRIQELFLDPVDYVVPTTAPRCVPIADWNRIHGDSPPSVPGTKCVLATLALWMLDVTLPAPLYDEERFLSDPLYAYHLGNFNILTSLVDHRDNRRGNFLVSKNDADRRVFAIDNGTTFGAFFFNWFYPPTFAWRNIVVPALPKKTVDRLREIERKDLDRLLAVVVQFEADDEGILRLVRAEAPIDPGEGVRLDGTTLQFGLTEREIDNVWDRLQDILEDVDEGRLGTF